MNPFDCSPASVDRAFGMRTQLGVGRDCLQGSAHSQLTPFHMSEVSHSLSLAHARHLLDIEDLHVCVISTQEGRVMHTRKSNDSHV